MNKFLRGIDRSLPACLALSLACGVGACGSDSGGGNTPSPLAPVAECEGESISPLSGSHQMVFSELTIGTRAEGFDLDLDGEPDNVFGAASSLAAEPLRDSFAAFDIVLPIEFFDLDEVGEDECVKFAIYQADYRLDLDGDDSRTAKDGGDCNDHLASVNPKAAEIPDNGIDDNCNGIADETDVPSTDTSDSDSDGVTIADGDCDDTNPDINPGLAEICGDGLDNNCDGVADYTRDADEPHCSPFDSELDPLLVSSNSLNADGSPQIAFDSGSLEMVDGVLKLRAGPSTFSLTLPLVEGIELELTITGTTIEADMVMTPGGWTLQNGRLGGVLDAYTADKARGLDIPEIGLRPEDSFADTLYANVLGTLLGLPTGAPGTPGETCITPDIDVDGDGLEAFCDTTPGDEIKVIDMCVDGDGTVVMDEGDTHCTEALDEDGNLRFVDGVSIMIKFETVPAALPATID